MKPMMSQYYDEVEQGGGNLQSAVEVLAGEELHVEVGVGAA